MVDIDYYIMLNEMSLKYLHVNFTCLAVVNSIYVLFT